VLAERLRHLSENMPVFSSGRLFCHMCACACGVTPVFFLCPQHAGKKAARAFSMILKERGRRVRRAVRMPICRFSPSRQFSHDMPRVAASILLRAALQASPASCLMRNRVSSFSAPARVSVQYSYLPKCRS